MGRQAKLKQKTKEMESSCSPILSRDRLKYRLYSLELRNWLIKEWHHLLDFELFVSPSVARQIASTMLEKLWIDLDCESSLDRNLFVKYNPSRYVQIAVGINVKTWSVFARVTSSDTGFEYVTSDKNKFRLL